LRSLNGSNAASRAAVCFSLRCQGHSIAKPPKLSFYHFTTTPSGRNRMD
jgi:hypothetical protein